VLDDEHRELRAALRRWAEAEVAPHAAAADRDAAFPTASWRSYVDNG
jgi:alkylation response protein AidB-like acyl-CoA dehydrogenase